MQQQTNRPARGVAAKLDEASFSAIYAYRKDDAIDNIAFARDVGADWRNQLDHLHRLGYLRRARGAAPGTLRYQRTGLELPTKALPHQRWNALLLLEAWGGAPKHALSVNTLDQHIVSTMVRGI